MKTSRKMKDPAAARIRRARPVQSTDFPIEPHSHQTMTVSYSQVLKSVPAWLATSIRSARANFPPNRSDAEPEVELESKRPLKSIYSPSHSVEMRRHGENKAVIGCQASKSSRTRTFKSCSLARRRPGLERVSYRSGPEAGYFLLLASPGITMGKKQLVLKDVAFVLDTSDRWQAKKDRAGEESAAILHREPERRRSLWCFDSLRDGILFNGLVDASSEIAVRPRHSSGPASDWRHGH